MTEVLYRCTVGSRAAEERCVVMANFNFCHLPSGASRAGYKHKLFPTSVPALYSTGLS